MAEPQPPPGDGGRISGWLTAVRGLTLTNVLVVALLAIVAIPAYTIYRALNDPAVMNRLMSTYEEHPDQSGCLIRHVKQRGGPDMWSIASGFAIAGVDRWFVSVIIPHAPTAEEVASYCESAKLLADAMRPDHGGRLADPAL